MIRRLNGLWVFAAASALTVGLGAGVMAQGGLGPGLWLRNPVAWVLGGALALFVVRRGWLLTWAPAIALLLIALTAFGPGQLGVYRWIGVGPLLVNAAALVLPLAIVAFYDRRYDKTVTYFVLAISTGLALQPDLSQVAGFVVAAVILFCQKAWWKGLVLALPLALCLMHPDPLEPVPHVEGIFLMAWGQSPVLAVTMAVTLAATALSPLLYWGTAGVKALALSGYFVVTPMACLLGAFPVPLAGYGLSFVLGWWLGMGALMVTSAKEVT